MIGNNQTKYQTRDRVPFAACAGDRQSLLSRGSFGRLPSTRFGLFVIAIALAVGWVAGGASAFHDDLPSSPFGGCGWVDGTVTDPSGDPVSGADVIALARGSGPLLQGYEVSHTDSDGYYELLLINGQWNVTVFKDPYAPKSFDVMVECQQRETRDVRLDQEVLPPLEDDGTITVFVDYSLGDEFDPKPLEDVDIRVFMGTCEDGPIAPADLTYDETRETDSTGHAEFADLPRNQDYCVQFTDSRYQDDSGVEREVSLNGASMEVGFSVKRVLQDLKVELTDPVVPGNSPPAPVDITVNIHHPVFCPDSIPSFESFSCTGVITGGSGDVDIPLPWLDEGEEYRVFIAQTHAHYHPIMVDVEHKHLSPGEVNEGVERRSGVLTGVIEDLDGNLQVGAEVCLWYTFSACTVTDADGTYSLRASWYDDYELRVKQENLRDYTRTGVGIDPGTVLQVEKVVMARSGAGTIAGNVCDEFESNCAIVSDAMQDMEIRVLDGSGVVGQTTPASNGEFSLPVMEGTYTVEITSPYYETKQVLDVEVLADREITIDDQTLERNRHDLVITVKDGETNELLEGANIQLRDSHPRVDTNQNEVTDENGIVTFTVPWDLQDYRLDFPDTDKIEGVIYAEKTNAQVKVLTRDSAPVPGEIRLDAPTGTVTGTVKDDDTDPKADLEGVHVFLSNDGTLDPDRYKLEDWTDEDGQYELIFPRGRDSSFTINYSHPHYEEDDETVTSDQLNSNPTRNVDLDRNSWMVIGNLVDEEGTTVSGAQIEFNGVDVDQNQNGQGNFQVTIPWGEYEVTVSHDYYEDQSLANLILNPTTVGNAQHDLGTIELVRLMSDVTGNLEGSSEGSPVISRDGFEVNCGDGLEADLALDGNGEFSFPIPFKSGTEEEPAYECEITDLINEYHNVMFEVVDPMQETSNVGTIEIDRREWTISGKVTDAGSDNQGVAGTRVCAFVVSPNLDLEEPNADPGINQHCTDDSEGPNSVTNPNGEFNLTVTYSQTDELRINQVLLWTTPTGYLPGANATMIGPDSGNTHPIEGVEIQVLPENPSLPLATLQGTVVDDDAIEEIGVAGADVTAQRQDGPCSLPGGQEIDTFHTATDALGNFVLPVACPGEYEVTVSHLFYYDIDQQMSATLIDDTIGNLEVDFERILMERFRSDASVLVINQVGAFVDNMPVKIDGVDVNEVATETTQEMHPEDGVAKFIDIPWGTYHVIIGSGEIGSEGESVLVVYPHVGGTSVAIAISEMDV